MNLPDNVTPLHGPGRPAPPGAALRNEVVALAALSQAVAAVRAVARNDDPGGDSVLHAVEVASGSALRIDSDSVDDVFGGIESVEDGLRALCAQLSGPRGAEQNEAARYAVGAVKLARDLLRQKAVAEQLQSELTRIAPLYEARRSAGETPYADDGVIEELADAYRAFVATLGPRIMVFGDPEILEQPRYAARVRVLLLGAVRAAVAWRQLGGSQWKLVLVAAHRKRLHDVARALLRGTDT